MSQRRVARIEVRSKPGCPDARAEAVGRVLQQVSPRSGGGVSTASVYLVECDAGVTTLEQAASELLADPVTEVATVVLGGAAGSGVGSGGAAAVEVHPLPGVMDPAAESVEQALRSVYGIDAVVRTGTRYEIAGVDLAAAQRMAEGLLANTVIHGVHQGAYHPAAFPKAAEHAHAVREVALLGLDQAALAALSRNAHLFLSVAEMECIQAEYRRLGREPREIELETIAQTWSEHCVHKTLKSRISYREVAQVPGMWSLASSTDGRPGHTIDAGGTVYIENLLRSTVAAATRRLTDPATAGHIDWCLSVFVDNSGVVAFDESHAVCFKVETHNRPSAIEPYGGAATGIGGCIRDVLGTGLGAKPIACTDVFCVAPPSTAVPQGCLAPARILDQVVAGVRDYGNRMGIPTVNGGVWFDKRYVGNPLVFCGTVGLMPIDKVRGRVEAGDAIVAIGGRTGRDGIHGATFSSAEVSHGHADEFSHAVQIGNAITEKKVLDLLLAARDHVDGCLYNGLTDCGAGGFSSAVGEMASSVGATVHLDRAPLKYAGLSPTEVWISEAQERMALAVPARHMAALRALCDEHQVELCELGQFGTADRAIHLNWHGTEIGQLDCEFLHNGIPTPRREAVWDPAWAAAREAPMGDGRGVGPSLLDTLHTLLAHGNIASKAWIIRQYDHEVQGTSVVKPLVGVGSGGPSDAAVIAPVAGSTRGLAIANGLATGLAVDPYVMVLAAIDECVRNLVCVGADPTRVAILDNFCWPDTDDPRNLGSLVRAAEACFDGAMAYRAPFISGKDSLRNQFRAQDGTLIEIPPTLLVSGFAPVERIDRCVTMDLKSPDSVLVLVGQTGAQMGGSHRAALGRTGAVDLTLTVTDLGAGPRNARAVAALIAAGLVRSAHDCSEGGLLVAAAEMAFAGGIGLELDLGAVATEAAEPVSDECRAFAETPSRYLLEVAAQDAAMVVRRLSDADCVAAVVGRGISGSVLRVRNGQVNLGESPLSSLRQAWSGPDTDGGGTH